MANVKSCERLSNIFAITISEVLTLKIVDLQKVGKCEEVQFSNDTIP